MAKLYYNTLLILSLLACFGAGIYRLYQLNFAGIFLSLLFTVIAFILLKKIVFCKDTETISWRLWSNIQYPNILIFSLYILSMFINVLTLIYSLTNNSIISPWQAVPWYFFLTYAAATIILITAILNLKSKILNFFLISLHFFLSVSIALVIYTIGFGFDPFIHQATEKLIDASGAVYPKPWYYLGQYALVVIFHKLTFIPIVWLDKLLVPALAALTLPYALYQAAKTFTADERVARLVALFSLIFPFTTFTLTTPQNLANLFLIIIILLSLNKNLAFNFLLFTLSLAAIAAHPIAGIPAVLFTAFIIIKQHISNKKLLFTLYSLLFTLSVIALPAAFYLNNQTNSVINAANDTAAAISWHLPTLFFMDTGNFLLNFLYLYGFNIIIIILLFIVIGVMMSKIRKNNLTMEQFNNGTIYLLMSLSLFLSYYLTKFVNFNYLINYERSNFSDRILIIAAYFAIPFILLALVKFIEKILQQERAVKYLFFCFLVFLLSCSLYFSYPRYDDYFNSRSFSTSQADIDAVNWINQDADDSNYIVLANQQVSAAALREFGFKKYYKIPSPYQGEGESEVFYYPIPTGEKLYQYYLNMVDKNADKKTALQAADLVGADTVYFVINNYWFGFEKILAEARLGADKTQSIDNGKIFVFKYINPVKYPE